ncbi:hypothetical protein QQS21_004122 [Conoideocrella luteorostrata]|uniref:Cytochrome P450 n=1 Tax=Conoideocrella luteorostrata TaxID=1105319 RepID=A0AAJ0CW24_9HYPO|nr:hypothetical protein QQS21_004122 [Conoideocrella luteorostrata]
MFSVKNVLGTPPECFRIYEEDDSGVDETPRQGSTTKQEDRIYYHQHHSAKKYLSAQHLSCLSERFIVILRRNLKIVEPETHDGGGRDRWVAFPDLYSFLQQHAGGATIETLMGSEILRLNPTLINDFWLFERSIPGFVRCLPRWLIPGKYRNRDRVLDALKKWHVHGHTHSDCSKIEPNDPEWDLYFGSKLVKARQLYSDKMKAMNADACASEDLGLLFASNSNSIPIIFWIIFEALKDHQLRKRLVSEVASCLCPNLAQFDMLKLLSQPLLQSSFAETLRLRTTTGVLRVSEHTLCNIGDYTIERGHQMIVFTRPIALNVAAWTQAGRPPTQPLEEFQADRFLVPTKETASTDSCSTHDDRRFSLEGLTGCWLPFGGGQSMCPGRHFAKRQVLSAFALFFTDYELELSPTVDVNKVLSDKGSVSIGGLPPVCKVPFRIRKREPVVDFT